MPERDRKEMRTDLKQRRRPYQSVPLRYRLTEEEIAKLAVNAHRLPGVSVEAQLSATLSFEGLNRACIGLCRAYQ